VELVEIDAIEPEPAQRCLAGGAKVPGATVVDELRERLSGGGERHDLLVCDPGEVPAENSAEPSAVILERDVPAGGQVDQDEASVAGPACPHHQSFLFELLDQDRDRWLLQALELSELGDPPQAAAEGFQQADFGSRELSAELSDEQPGEQRRSREQGRAHQACATT